MKPACLAAALLAFTFAGQTASGVIDGMVLDDAGSPVPSASVALMSDTGRVVKTLDADDTGAFLFDGLAAGRFTVGASRVGYAARGYGQASPNAASVVIALATNGRFTARVRLARVGGISGTIVDEDGQPVSVAVRALRFVMQNGVRTVDDRAITTDADRLGRYRFADLPPGDYLVSALGPDGELRRMTPDVIQRALQAVQQPGQPLPSGNAGGESTVSYVTVYYPGVVSRARATAVTLAAGEERTNINLQLQVLPTMRVDGTVVDPDGKPLPYADVRLVSADDGVTWSYGQASPTAYFRLAPVPLAQYRLVVYSPARGYPAARNVNPNGLWAMLDIAPGLGHAMNVTVRTEPAGSVSGRVVFDGTTARPDCRRGGCGPTLVARPTQPGGVVSAGNVAGVMDSAGPIVFSGVPPGAYAVALSSPMTGWTMESAAIDGREAMDLPIEIGARQDVAGLVVTFSDRQTELAGSTPVGGTAPAADTVSVVVFPADRRLWAPGARRVRVARPDTSGQYRIAGLPPGEYLVAVVTNFDAESELDAARLATLEAGATRVAVRRPDPR
jgi:protocatechuate 3,4-dioxygenase beta subunit